MDKSDALIVKVSRSILRIYCDDIVFFESSGHYVNIHMKDGKVYPVRGTIASVETMPGNNRFVRIRRGIVVNLQYVSGISKGDAVLDSLWGRLPVGRLYKEAFAEAFDSFKKK